MKFLINFLFILILFTSCEKSADVGLNNLESKVENRSSNQIPDINSVDEFDDRRNQMFDDMIQYVAESTNNDQNLGGGDGPSILCTQECYREYRDCMWYPESFYHAYWSCLDNLQFCRDSECPPDWCDSVSEESCEELRIAIIPHMEEIIAEIEKCDDKQFDCLAKCDKGPNEEL